MIKIEIIDASDQIFLGVRLFIKNYLTIGNNICDIPLRVENDQTYILFLKIHGKELHCFPNKNLNFYLLNEKRTNSPTKIFPGDVIGIESFRIKITSYQANSIYSRQEFYEKKIAEKKQRNYDIYNIIHKIYQHKDHLP